MYDIKNNDKKTIEILKYLNRDLILLSRMQNIETKRYKEDPFIISHGFVVNNNSEKYNMILKEIIIKENFTIIFSFCYSPVDNNENNKSLDESINKGKMNKNEKKENGIPIIQLTKEDQTYINEKTGFCFFIRDGYLYHRIFNFQVVSMGDERKKSSKTSYRISDICLNLARVEPTTVCLAAFIHLTCTHF